VVFWAALGEDAREDVVVECAGVQPLAQWVFVGELLGDVARVGPGGLVGAVVLRLRGARFVDAVAVAVGCEQPR
jgi:hypothetical protein